MNSFIISSLKKKRTKHTKRFDEKSTGDNKDILNNQANKCTGLIIQAKEKHIAKMSAQLDNLKTAPKAYWSIISRFLNRRKMPAIPPILADGKLVSGFKIKPNFLILILLPSVLQSKMQVHYQSLNIELINV